MGLRFPARQCATVRRLLHLPRAHLGTPRVSLIKCQIRERLHDCKPQLHH